MGRVLWKRLKSARMGKEQKGSTRDLTTAVGRAVALASHILAAALCVVQYIPIYYWIGDRGLACRWVQPWFISTTRCPAKTTARSYKPPILASKSEWIQNRSCSWHGIAEKSTLDLHFHLSRGGTYLTKINFLKFFRRFLMFIYVSYQDQKLFLDYLKIWVLIRPYYFLDFLPFLA